jgi:hypothetical protein
MKKKPLKWRLMTKYFYLCIFSVGLDIFLYCLLKYILLRGFLQYGLYCVFDASSIDASFTGPIKCFSRNVQNGSCVWQCNSSKEPLQILDCSNRYYAHSAIEVVLNDGEKVIVDWNIGQFQNLDEGKFVFVIQCYIACR